MAREPNSYYNQEWKDNDDDLHTGQAKCLGYDPFCLRLAVDTAEYGMKKFVRGSRIGRLKGPCGPIQDFQNMSKGVKYSNDQRTKDQGSPSDPNGCTLV